MKFKNWFWGLFFILAGGAFIANSLDLFTSRINFLSLLLAILLVAIIVGSLIHFNFFGILVPLSLIGVIFAEELNITHITPWPLIITAVLVSIGLEIIFGNQTKSKYIGINIGATNDEYYEEVNHEDGENVKYQVSFGAGVKYVNSENFKKGYFSCKFGAMSVYFDNAKPSKDGTEIVLDVAFAGVELYIPKDWNVVTEASVMLGGLDESRRREKKDGPTVTIKGNISLAGVDIIYI